MYYFPSLKMHMQKYTLLAPLKLFCTPPLFRCRLDGLKHAPRQHCLEKVILSVRDGKDLSLKHISLKNQIDIKECLQCSKNACSPCLFPLLCLPGQPYFSPDVERGREAGGRGVCERPWSKVSTWQQEPSVYYFKLWTPDRTFCFQHSQGQRDLGKDQEATGRQES